MNERVGENFCCLGARWPGGSSWTQLAHDEESAAQDDAREARANAEERLKLALRRTGPRRHVVLVPGNFTAIVALQLLLLLHKCKAERNDNTPLIDFEKTFSKNRSQTIFGQNPRAGVGRQKVN